MSDLQVLPTPAPLPFALGMEQLAQSPGAMGNALAGKDAEKAAKSFESVLLYKMMDEMQRTIPDSGLLGDGASKQVQSMFWFYLAEEAAKHGGLGLWQDIRRQIAPADGAGYPPTVGQD